MRIIFSMAKNFIGRLPVSGLTAIISDIMTIDNEHTGKGSQPVDSATVVLLRQGPNGLEVYLMRRSKGQSFMGGVYVFPGGKLDDDDMAPGLTDPLACVHPGESLEAIGCSSEQKAMGLCVCGVRELFEEAGVLLAYDESGRIIDLSDPSRKARFAELRKKVHGNEVSLLEVLQSEGLRLALDRLLPYAHWITPEIRARRFSTRFFLAILPDGQSASHDEVELVEGKWFTPAAALTEAMSGNITLMPPTLKTIEELSCHSCIDDVIKSATGLKIPPILPQPFMTDGGYGVRLPHDPEYEIEGYKQKPKPGETSRLIHVNGKWRTEAGE